MPIRLVMSTVIAVVIGVALGGAVFAGGSFGGPGTFTFKDTFATAQLSDSTGASLFITADFGMQTFKFRGVSGPPVIVGPETVLSYFATSADGSTTSVGCFVIPDSSFQVGSGLTTATLKVDPTIETPCPGFLIAPGAGGRPGLAGIAPDAGGGGGSTPITANLVWTSNGAVMFSSNTSNTRCQGTVAASNGSSASTIATVSGSASPLLDVFTQFATVQQLSSREVLTRSFSSACVGG
jgi:hypothetical protein